MTLAVIGGTGLYGLDRLKDVAEQRIPTPYSDQPVTLSRGLLNGHPTLFLARHGTDHSVPPHRINYRANLWALRKAGADRIIAVAAVGGIAEDLAPGRLAFPDQLIDYTWGRASSFCDDAGQPLTHIDFTEPYSAEVREQLCQAAERARVDARVSGCYAATQGPRLETAAEIQRLARDGCHMVGMTGMPEAALARELEVPYATCAVVANRAAGLGDGEGLSMEQIRHHLVTGMDQVGKLLQAITGQASPAPPE